MQIKVGTRGIGKATDGVLKHGRLSNLDKEGEKNSENLYIKQLKTAIIASSAARSLTFFIFVHFAALKLSSIVSKKACYT